MSLAKHHNLRTMMGLTWRGEYVLGIIEEEGECKTSHIYNWGVIESEVKNILRILREKGLVQSRPLDKKTKLHSLTDYGREYIEQVRNIYVNAREKS